MANRLQHTQSAYLRQHADNPVQWWPWSAEAFAEAARRDVPVFISIGYAACHWCHVMAGESFDDQAIAELLNQRFVNIKVDREEHPDVDDAYMAATQAMTGQGGWPMSVFTLPDGRVFHTGTYFPPRRMGQMPSFSEVIDAVTDAWTQRRDQVEEQAQRIAEALSSQRRRQSQMATVVDTGEGSASLDAELIQTVTDQALAALAEQEDTTHGGFGSAPKFPPSPLLTWLLEVSAEHPASPATGLAVRILENMARSALFDQVEGGFARYATDRAWQLPHFEKMLYDNAQLMGHYARLSEHAAATSQQRADARRTAQMTIDWLRQRMLMDEGLLASSLDADTVEPDGRHIEGGTYLFSDAELAEAAQAAGLSDQQAQRLTALNRGVPADEHALARGGPLHITEDTPRTLHFDKPLTVEERELWQQVVPELQRRRQNRTQPGRDEKIVAAWNAMAIISLAEAAALWQDTEVLAMAEELGNNLWEIHVHSESGSAAVYRTSYAGTCGTRRGTLSDHALTAQACFALASARGGHMWLERGAAVLASIRAEFISRAESGDIEVLDALDEEGLLSAAQQGGAYATPIDGPEPSGVGALAQALQLGEALGVSGPLRAEAEGQEPWALDLLQHVAAVASEAPVAVGSSLLAARRALKASPALRFFSGTTADVAQARQLGVLYGVPVEPVTEDAVHEDTVLQAGRQISVCLNSPQQALCLAPSSSVEAALGQLS